MNDNKQLFDLGLVLFSNTINIAINNDEQIELFISQVLQRHKSGDWGDLGKEDQKMNATALLLGYRLFSSYKVPSSMELNNDNIWIITESKDSTGKRRCTTILFPSEY